MKYLFLILCLCQTSWAACLGNANAQYLLFSVADSDTPDPMQDPAVETSFIVGKTPVSETTISIAGSGQMYCHQKYANTWVEDTNFPVDHLQVLRPFLKIAGISSNLSVTQYSAYYRDDAVRNFGTHYSLFEQANTPYQGYYTCQDSVGSWYFKYCACKNLDCS